nr:ATP-binding protein [Cupriavidus sp. D39]
MTIEQNAGGAIVTRPHALHRILTNLMDNAIKFSGAAELSVRRDRDTVRIDVMGSRSWRSGRQAGGCVAAIFRLEGSRGRKPAARAWVWPSLISLPWPLAVR